MIFLFFGALLWPNGLIFWSFVNCSEEILSVAVWKYFCFGPGNFFGFLKILCFCPKIKFFGNLWRSLAASKYWPFFKILYRLPEGLERFQKKGKSSEFNPQDYEKVQSSPALTVWSHESVKDCRKNLILGQKHKIFKNPKKFPGPKQKYF